MIRKFPVMVFLKRGRTEFSLTMKKTVLVFFALCICTLPAYAADDSATFNAAGALYNQSVDLAYAGNYDRALEAADQALALNASSMTALIQANRAGILVQLKRYDEAITAADAAISVKGNLTTAHAYAYYSRGDALRALGRTDEARVAYDQAHELDTTLISPLPSPTTSPAFSVVVIAAGISAILMFRHIKKQ